jgi:hypothetical protein
MTAAHHQLAATLLVRQGPGAGQRFVITGPAATIGRHSGCDFQIDDPELSRQHARITWSGTGYVVEDLGSVNGTFVNGEQISGPRLLQDGDLLRLGEGVELAFQATAAALPSEPAVTKGGGFPWMGVVIGALILLCLCLVLAGGVYWFSQTQPGISEIAAPLMPTPTAVRIKPTDTPPPNPTATSAPESSAPAPLDLCSLVTQAEAEAVLGGPVISQPSPQFCSYSRASGSPNALSVGAAQGDQAKAFAMQWGLMLSGDKEQAGKVYEELQVISATLTLKDLVGQVLKYAGNTVEPVAGVGDEAYWLWIVPTDQDGKPTGTGFGQLWAVKGDTLLVLTLLLGLDSGPTREAAQGLAGQALGRLPPKFTTSPASDQGEVRVTVAAPTIEVSFGEKGECFTSSDCKEGFHCFNSSKCLSDDVLKDNPTCKKCPESGDCTYDQDVCLSLECENCSDGKMGCAFSTEKALDGKCVECFMDGMCKKGYVCEEYKCVAP